MSDAPSNDLDSSLNRLLQLTWSKVPGSRLDLPGLQRQLLQEIQAAARTDGVGKGHAPDQYTLSLHPGEITLLYATVPDAQSLLSHELSKVLREAGYRLAREPHITLATDPTLEAGEARVIAWHSRDPLLMSGIVPPVIPKDSPPHGAFLIVDGRKHFPLVSSVVTIGRNQDNDLLLASPHISRKHAQLRVKDGKYVITDLDSTSGTLVNGSPVREARLEPGDVITLANVEMIYGEDPGGPPGVTPPYAPPFRFRADRDRITPLDLRVQKDLALRTSRLGKKPKS
jgi:hypothetical protein